MSFGLHLARRMNLRLSTSSGSCCLRESASTWLVGMAMKYEDCWMPFADLLNAFV